MLLIILIRWAIFLTFILLVIEGIALIIILRRFYGYYERRHSSLEVRIAAVERRLGIETPEQT